jgi:predicted SAM-dependent methyltransferase
MDDKLNYLNLGCGHHFNKQWVNVDFSKTGDGVIGHNLLKGIPFHDDTFEVVYHSHVLEHFQKDDAKKFVDECYRVLKPGGVIRVVIPDLEEIANHYIRLLNEGKKEPENSNIRDDYDWILIEMFDQTVRTEGGGGMLKYLARENLNNIDFIYQRIGHEGKMLREGIVGSRNSIPQKVSFVRIGYRKLRALLRASYKDVFFKFFAPTEYKFLESGRFRAGGEVHQWMYDIYSIGNLLKDAGFKGIQKRAYNESHIKGWAAFGLDEVNNQVRKPDSLFVEAVK